MPVTINGTTGVDTPGVVSSGAVSGTTGTFSGNVTANGLTTELRPLVLGTSQASTSGTSIDFTGIPSWVKRVTVVLDGVSTNGTSIVAVQLGDSGGVESSGYNSLAIGLNGAVATSTSSFILDRAGSATLLRTGVVTINKLSGNSWVFSSVIPHSALDCYMANGSKTLSDVLDRIRITTVNGTATFDARSINIMYE